jgi:hypothetical protein
MPQVYRAMTEMNGLPQVGSTARTLGVRVPTDIAVDAAGRVSPGTGGMSVVPRWRDLPRHRIPTRLRHAVASASGSNLDACFRLGDGGFVGGGLAPGLHLRVHSTTHGFVEPQAVEPLGQYRDDVAATREQWIIDEA